MANEITVQVSLIASKGNVYLDSRTAGAPVQTQLDMSGTNVAVQTQTVATGSWQAVAFGNISGAPGMFHVKNLDATNYVRFALDNAGAKIFCRLKKGQQNIISLESGTLYAEADTASVAIEFWATEV
jgi:hypothetical protein